MPEAASIYANVLPKPRSARKEVMRALLFWD